tara:strand:+ start:284 stop:505 length:222 start_codon:yes stop_codon:yes gene_type:complete
MPIKLYKGQNSIMVRGMDVQARLNDGWTTEPSTTTTTKITLRPRRAKKPKLEREVEDLPGPDDLNIEETTNGD